jgi:hypothetical protein
LFDASKTHFPKIGALAKPQGDSLYIFIDDSLRGVRSRLYYSSESGLATFSEVKYKFAVWRNIEYDSVNIVVDVNFTLFNPSDDMLKSLYRLQLFEVKFFVQKIESNLLVTHFEANQITGAEATNEAWYHADRFLQYLKQSVDINPDESFRFRDGKTSSRRVTFYSDFTGEFERILRDGTVVSGTFNSIEDDQKGSFTELIDFPEGRYVEKINKSAIVEITLPDSIFNADFKEAIHFRTGRIDSSSIGLMVWQDGDVKKTELDIRKANGAFGAFGHILIEEMNDEANLIGEWTTWNEYYITINAEYYFDGSAHIHYEVFAPPYEPGDAPIFVADYYISPDGSGNGKLSHDGELFHIVFDGSDRAEIIQGEKRTTIDLFQ